MSDRAPGTITCPGDKRKENPLTNQDLIRAVAVQTGESRSFVNRRGFNLLNQSEERKPLTYDWDDASAAQSFDLADASA